MPPWCEKCQTHYENYCECYTKPVEIVTKIEHWWRCRYCSYINRVDSADLQIVACGNCYKPAEVAPAPTATSP